MMAAYKTYNRMNGISTLYTVSLVVANMATAGVMYRLNSPLFTVVLGIVGVVLLSAATLTETEPRSGPATTDDRQRV